MPRCAHPLTLLLAVLLWLAPGARAQQGSVETDTAALQALYNATNGANWTDSTNWGTNEDLASWHGVTTNSDGRVTRLELQENGLNGTLPTELGDLTALESLRLDGNVYLTGSLPSGLRELPALATVDLTDTELCAPEDTAFQDWTATVSSFSGLICPPASQTVIDVAVFYTPAARDNAGGTAAIEAEIDLMAAETNLACRASGVNQRLALAAVEEVEYTAKGATREDIDRLQDPSDGHMDEVHTTRDQVAADIVVLIVIGHAGIAYDILTPANASAANAFATSGVNSRTFAHELGHLMGLDHDRYVACVFDPSGLGGDGCSEAATAYAYGYVNQQAFEEDAPVSARWRTVMAYDSQCHEAGCPQLLRFSNPDQIHPDPGGDPLGVAGREPSTALDGPADAVRTLNRTRATVANFRTPTAVTVSFDAAAYTAAEGGEAATVTVNLSPVPGRPVSVPLVSVGATGATASDYTAPGSVAFAATETAQTFTVTAVDDDADDDGETVTLAFDTRVLPSGMTVGSPATATVTLTDDDLVTAAPSVRAVALTSDPGPDAIYALGDEIAATVRFDKSVTVTGTPQLGLTVGSGTPRQMTHRGGGGEVLTFAYTVAEDDSDTDGVSIAADSLSGTIRDSANENAMLTHVAVEADAGHRVDGVRPLLQGAVADGNRLTLTYAEALHEGSLTETQFHAPDAFTVTSGGNAVRVDQVAVMQQTVRLDLSGWVLRGDAVTVSYSPGANPIRDAAGNEAAAFSDRSATNETPQPHYDTDHDGLIEITTLAQLDAVRHDLDGDGTPSGVIGGPAVYRAAFPLAFPDEQARRLGCHGACIGYELLADLDFLDVNGDGRVDTDDDTNGDGRVAADDTTWWNGGAGWDPIRTGGQTSYFAEFFEGNGHAIRHLFINRPSKLGVGLFANSSSNIRNVGVIEIDVTGNTGVGGLVGINAGRIEASYATGPVSGTTNVGGLVGASGGPITTSYATGPVSGEAQVGGLVGYGNGRIEASYATGPVWGTMNVGGLVGSSRGPITTSYATGPVSGEAQVGGLVGYGNGRIEASYATGPVWGTINVGGLGGFSGGPITTSYATGPVSGKVQVGGLVGDGNGGIAASYATGPVSGTTNVGGLVGASGGPITTSYATGPVSGEVQVGGLVGLSPSGEIHASYWDTTTSGQATGSNGQGQTTTQLQTPTGYTGLYADWNVDLDGDGTADDPWHLGLTDEYPVLKGTGDWKDFGHQIREGPTLTAAAGAGQVVLEWTAVDAGHWSPAPNVTYTLYRDDGATVEAMAENLSGLGYTDTGVTAGETYTYQVAAVVTGGEATRSALTTSDPVLPDMWLNPPESDPVAPVRSAATYSVTFQGAWTTTVTAGGLPSGAHFTTLIGGVHNAGVTFLREGGMASAGVESMAELGGTSTLATEVNRAKPNALSVLQGSGGNIGPASSSTISTVTLTTDHPRVTLLSMVAPSPDWFVGVSGLSLLDAHGDWLASRTVDLYPWDAGTEEGTEFSLSNAATSPQGVITSLRGVGKFSNAPIATLTFTRQSINTAPSITSDTSFEADENQTAVAALQATDNDTASDQLTWSIPSGDGGGADAHHFALSSTGFLAFSTAKDYENPDDADGDRTYEVRVQVSDGANPVEADLIVRLLDVDDAAPALSSATVNGTRLTLTYDEALDGNSTPASGDFTVSGGDQARTVTRVSVSGSTVLLVLNAAAEHLEAGIQVSYTPGTNPIRDVPGNQAVGLSREPVTNETLDTTPPEVESLGITSNPGSDQTYAAEDEIEVTVTFSETVKVEGTPRLRLRVGNRTRTAGYLRGTGTAAPVFGYEVADGDEDTDGVSVNAGRIALNGGTIEDEAENAAELDHEAVAAQAGHQVDGVRPSFLSAAVDGASLTLTYGEGLDGGSRPASGDFTVEVGESGRSVTGVSVSGSGVTLFLNPAVEHGDTGIRVSYTVPAGVGANPIQDEVGNEARGLSSRSVTNTTGAPNTDPEITSPSSFDVPENQLVARRLAARDTDPGDEVTGWDIVGGADQSQFSIASDTGELSFRTAPDFEAPGDNQYLVTVEVRSGAGARELTAEQTLTISVTDEREPPEVPEAPTFSGETADSLTVRWSEPDNTGPPITDYDVQVREEGRGGFTDAQHDGPGLSLTLSDLEAGTLYQVQVRATNEEGTSGWSDAGEGMTVTPLTVGMASGTEPPVSGAFTVRFSYSEPVTGFSRSDIETQQEPACRDSANNTVFCDAGIGGLETTDDRVFTTTVTPWTDRVAHSYTLRLTVPAGAVRSSVGSKPNEEPEELLEVRVAPPGVEEPISSIGFQASPGSGSVRLSWNRPSDNGGSAIIRYEYRYQAVGEAWSEWENVGAGTRSVTVGNLINGREYVFEVRAVSALGKGGVETVTATPEQRVTPPPPPGGGGGGALLFPPEAPAGLMATAGDGAVRLEWSPPASDGGTSVLRYEYRLKEGRGEFGEWTSIPDSAPDEVNASGYTVGGLGNGTVHVFELRAVNAAGNGQLSEAVEVVMRLDPAYWSNFRAEDLEGAQLRLEVFLSGGSGDRELRFGEGLRFEEDELDGEGEVTATRMGGYGYRYTSRTTGRLPLDFDGGEACELRLTFSGEGTGSYIYRCGGTLEGQGSFRLSGLNRVPEITNVGPFEVEENTTRVGQLEAVDWDEEDAITGYGITGGADGALFTVEAETGELRFREAPDYENPGDVASEDPQSPAGDNEYILVVEVRSGEGERERRREQGIRVRVSDQEEEGEGEEETGEDETESLFIPVILSSAGRNQSFFTSELTLTNRGEQEVSLDYTYTAKDEPGRRSGTASDVLPAGRQKIETDALTYLRGLGVPIPETGNQLGTLRVEVPLGSEVEAVVRTTTVVPEGRAGLAYLGVAQEEGFEEAVYLCGLRQNAQDRSNVAIQNMGGPEEGAITLKTTVYSGEAADASPRVLREVELEPGGFHQYSPVLGDVANGYVKVERVEGTAPFYAYGVINDQANSDGSFIFPVTASSLAESTGQTLPVVVETNAFRSELTVTNFSEEPRKLDFQFVADGIEADNNTAAFSMTLEAGQQEIVAEVVEELRRQGVAGLGATRGFYAGPLFVVAEGGDMSGIVIGARTGSEGGGGSYSVFYSAVPFGEAFSREAWVDGLQQNQENRSNLALVNTGEVDGSASVFHLEIYDGETGLLVETVVTKPVPARGWHQIDGILLRSSPETRQGYVRIEKVSGENPFLAYGVVNDGGAPGERSGDGAYLPARE